jgi:hypothetical protein
MLSARTIAVALASGAWGTTLAAQRGGAAPDGVTPARTTLAPNCTRSSGMCFVSGRTRRRRAEPDDAVWIHSKGTFPEIVQQILAGVPASQSKSGVMMPPRGGGDLSADQVEAVAAYVWGLSHPRAK